MSKKIILTLALLMTFGGNAVFAANPFNYDLQKDMNRTRDKKLEEQRAAKAAKEAEARGETVPQQQANQKSSTAAQSNPVSRKLEFSEKYYPNAKQYVKNFLKCKKSDTLMPALENDEIFKKF